MQHRVHPFFCDIENYPDLIGQCRTDITNLPEPFKGNHELKAILLGADPTNNGIRNKPGLVQLDKVFGINSEYEKDYFSIHLINLNAIGLEKDNLYIQNVCRNYFYKQTTENKQWPDFAKIWKPYLIEDLKAINANVPILATSGEIFTFLTGVKGPFTNIYSMETTSPFYSVDFKRNVFPLFRAIAYIFRKGKHLKYREHLKNYFTK